ncbi:unnamed protein product [Moneuplotes crassus]|uniref:AP2/ERF domain-containing protein n=1 Tax=Euplotes crassus TaxID=5936 RepID=A0AAD1XKL0_EUPCR|nr:unnamed protein product [Moneuplotes crassus]
MPNFNFSINISTIQAKQRRLLEVIKRQPVVLKAHVFGDRDILVVIKLKEAKNKANDLFFMSPNRQQILGFPQCLLFKKRKFDIYNIKMNISNFSCGSNLTAFSKWRYSDIIRDLEKIYCMSGINEEIQSLPCSCTYPPQPTPLVVQNLPHNNPNLPKTSFPISPPLTPKALNRKSTSRPSDAKTSEEAKQEVRSPVVLKKRRRRTELLDISQKLLKMKASILKQYVKGFESVRKRAKSANQKNFSRRSKYIGVSKNICNWQALINVGSVKKYIGTFVDEHQAARAFDIYSIALRGEKAPINFDYTAKEMLERIEYFLENNSVMY